MADDNAAPTPADATQAGDADVPTASTVSVETNAEGSSSTAEEIQGENAATNGHEDKGDAENEGANDNDDADDDADDADDDDDDSKTVNDTAAADLSPTAPKKAQRRKRPKSAYMWFMMDKQAEIQAQNPGERVGTIAKIIGSLWRELTDEDKKIYTEKAAADKERFRREEAAVRRIVVPRMHMMCDKLTFGCVNATF